MNSQDNTQPKKQSITVLDEFYWITPNQSKILEFLIKNKSGITNTLEIQKVTGIKYGSIKKVMRSLVSEKCITKPVRYRRGQFQGFSYTINQHVCNSFKPEIRIREIGETHEDSQKNIRSKEQAISILHIQNIIDHFPELGYWKKRGLSAKQVAEWMKIYGVSLDAMVQYLCYCRFELVDLGMEERKKIEDVLNWFYQILEKTGAYPKPKGYKSFEEKNLEMERLVVEEKNRQAQEAEKRYKQKLTAELNKQFWDMMNSPESDLYLQCLNSLTDFQKRKKFGKGFEMSMQIAFEKIMGN